jgi:paired amphipathic helix protein Sin3a
LNNEEAYSEFLKCINIYSSEIITKSELLDLVDDIIGEHQDLMKTLKKLLTPSNSIG